MLDVIQGGRRDEPKPKAPDLGAALHPWINHAVAALVASLDDPDLRLGAIRIIFERCYGKPPQMIESSQGAQALTALHLLAARALSQAFQEQSVERSGPVFDARTPPKDLDDLSSPATE